MKKVLDEFIAYVKRKSYSTHTIYDYNYTLSTFFNFIADYAPDTERIESIDRDLILAYEKYLAVKIDGKGNRYSINRRRRFLTNLKTFFAYLEKNELIEKNPAVTIALPREKKRIIRNVLTIEEMKKVLTSCRGRTLKSLRDRTMLEVLYSTGMRADELCNVELRDLDLSEETIYIRKGKWDSERLVPFGKTAERWLVSYLERGRPLLAERDSPLLFLSMRGKKLQPQALLDVVQYWSDYAGIEKKITTHSFRHSCATHMLQGNADIRFIQFLLGHKNISTTELYLTIELSDLKKVHKNSHPRESKNWNL